MITMYDLILPAMNSTRSLYTELEHRVLEIALQLLAELKSLVQQTSHEARFIRHLCLFVLSLCCFGGVQAPEYAFLISFPVATMNYSH